MCSTPRVIQNGNSTRILAAQNLNVALVAQILKNSRIGIPIKQVDGFAVQLFRQLIDAVVAIAV